MIEDRCCDIAGKKYIDKDGKINFNSEHLFGIRVRLELIENSNDAIYIKEYLKYKILNSICLCDCHKEDVYWR